MDTEAKTSRLTRKSRIVAAIIAITSFAILPWQASEWVRQSALGEIADRSRYTLNLVVENLKGELAKYSSQPLMLASNPNYVALLERETDSDLIQSVNLELERINTVSGASATYLMNASGLTIAASNWSSKKTFVGRNFSFRPYFKAAMEGRLGRYFALGTTSGKRGYYFAYPVRNNRSITGVVVVKMEVDHLESAWRSNDLDIIVTDSEGVVFLSSNSAWLFHTTTALSRERRKALDESRQYADRPLHPLKLTALSEPDTAHALIQIEKDGAHRVGTARPPTYLVEENEMKTVGWKVMILAHTTNVRWHMNLAKVVTVLLLGIVMLFGANIYQRRRRIEDRIRFQEAANETLEKRVTERTTELRETNQRLIGEIHERTRAEEELRRTQSSLVQATKLAALGQMSAGLSHEINQPMAAIGTYADNARTFIERGDTGTALKNLTSISGLIKRMARIINNLRTYARNEPVAVSAVPLAEAIEGALDLLHQRIVSEEIDIHYNPIPHDLRVDGGEVRLQQVFVNLFSNSLDAMRASSQKQLSIYMSHLDGKVRVYVCDTGTGIDDDEIGNVFDPFYSTKDTGQGMGLGLSITYGIVKQFGGSIKVRNGREGGAEFIVTLNEASEQKGEAA